MEEFIASKDLIEDLYVSDLEGFVFGDSIEDRAREIVFPIWCHSWRIFNICLNDFRAQCGDEKEAFSYLPQDYFSPGFILELLDKFYNCDDPDTDKKRGLIYEQLLEINLFFIQISIANKITCDTNKLNKKNQERGIQCFWSNFSGNYASINQNFIMLVYYDYLHKKPSYLRKGLKPRWNGKKSSWEKVNNRNRKTLEEINNTIAEFRSKLSHKELSYKLCDDFGRSPEAAKQLIKRFDKKNLS